MPTRGHPSVAFATPSPPFPPHHQLRLSPSWGGARGGAGLQGSRDGGRGRVPRASAPYLVLLRVVGDGLQVAHQELERLVVVTWQVPDLQGGTASPLCSPPLPFPPHTSTRGGGSRAVPPTPPLLPLPTSFRSVLILSLASSIRLASMKSLYLSGSRTWEGGSESGGGERTPPRARDPWVHQPEMLGVGVLLGPHWDGARKAREGQGLVQGAQWGGGSEPLALCGCWLGAWGPVPNTGTGGTGSGAAAQPSISHRHSATGAGASVATLGVPMAPGEARGRGAATHRR